jgi:hypothetical protein
LFGKLFAKLFEKRGGLVKGLPAVWVLCVGCEKLKANFGDV